MQQEELNRYRERLVALSDRLREEIDELDTAISGEGSDAGDLSHVPTHSADRDTEELEADEAMERNQVALLQLVEDALGRIETGTFGKCEDCGGTIPAKRLDAVPYTAFCVDCERAHE